jgi:iron complex outermembrane recepter protein
MYRPVFRSLSAALLFATGPVLADNPAAELEAPTIEVVGTTPLPGLGTPINQVPANVQAHTGEDMAVQGGLSVGDFLDANLSGVNVNQGQNNPYQPDVNFRGLTASPLLGTPQGLSVFMDGVRINEPFGDAVNWDFVPQNAVSTINLIPGSNPVFGLNTLGGALSINTKSGFQYPGSSVSALGGSWRRKSFEFEHGGHGEKNDVYVAGTFFDEDGWRDHSSSQVRQMFAKFGREEAETDFDLSIVVADNTLEGTQALPISYLGNRQQAYTWPDRNENQLVFLNGRASHFFDATTLLAANIYLRNYTNNSFSSNVNDDCEDPAINPGFCVNGFAGTPSEPQAINDRSKIDTNGFGGTVQLTLLGDLQERKNSFTAGASADLGRTDFTQSAENADFTPDRGTLGQGIITQITNVKTSNNYYGLFFTDTHSLSERLHLTLSGRYNWAKVSLRDQSGIDPQLNGDHSFKRFNPAAGLNFNPNPTLSSYVSYSEGMRAPTPVELTCADPAAPCRLPNNFLADPPLNKVVSKTMEAGLRGKIAGGGWNFAAFNTDLNDDIQFISSGSATNAGFFQNVGKTRRRGLEAGFTFNAGILDLSANYSYVRATFESSFLVNSPNNSTRRDLDRDGSIDDIQVSPGKRIPGIPAQALKLRGDLKVAEGIDIGATLNRFGSQYARGDENNQDARGQIPGYTLVHLDARYQSSRQLQFFAKVNNLFDKKYETLGVLGENFFVNGTFDASNVVSEQFRSVGSERGFWVGVKYEIGGAKSD